MATLAAVAGAGAGWMFAEQLDDQLGLAGMLDLDGQMVPVAYAALGAVLAYVLLGGMV